MNRLSTAVLSAAVAVAATLALPVSGTDSPPDGTTGTMPALTTTTSLSAVEIDEHAQDAALADWVTQECGDVYGEIDDPDPLPDRTDPKGCGWLLHDWRNARMSLATRTYLSADAHLAAVTPAYIEARRARNAAIIEFKTAEYELADIVHALAPPTTSTSTTTLPPKTTTTTSTTVPPLRWWCHIQLSSPILMLGSSPAIVMDTVPCSETAEEWVCDVNAEGGYTLTHRPSSALWLPPDTHNETWRWCSELPDPVAAEQ